MHELFDHPLITVYYHERPKIVHHQFRRATQGHEADIYKQALEGGIEALKVNGATKWLSDDRFHYVLPPELQAWTEQTWFPLARRAGWRHWAIVQPHTAVAKLFIGRVVSAVQDRGVDVRVFSDVDGGLAWLASLP